MNATSSTAMLKVGVLGAGYFAQFHHDAWRRNPRSDLAAVVSRRVEKAAQTGAAAFADPKEMLREIAPDIVDIAYPPETHLALIETALDHGPRAIVCQKPFCQDLDEARQAVALAESANVPLIIHENFRFQPWYRALKRELDAARLGDVYQMTFRLRPGDGQGPEAYLARQPYFQTMTRFLIHETGIHWIDTFRYLFGEPDTVYADLRRLNPAIAGEDAGMFVFGYADGRRAIFDGNRLADHPVEDRRWTMGDASVEGRLGEIRLTGDGALCFRAHGALSGSEIEPPPPRIGFSGDCVYALQDHVVRGLLDGAPFENAARDYLRNVEIEAAIYRAAETGQTQDIRIGDAS